MNKKHVILAIIVVLVVAAVVTATTVTLKKKASKKQSVAPTTPAATLAPLLTTTLSSPAPIVEVRMTDEAFAPLLKARKTFGDLVAQNFGTMSDSERATNIPEVIKAHDILMRGYDMPMSSEQQAQLGEKHLTHIMAAQAAGYDDFTRPVMTDEEAKTFETAFLIFRDSTKPEETKQAARTLAPLLGKQLSHWRKNPLVRLPSTLEPHVIKDIQTVAAQ